MVHIYFIIFQYSKDHIILLGINDNFYGLYYNKLLNVAVFVFLITMVLHNSIRAFSIIIIYNIIERKFAYHFINICLHYFTTFFFRSGIYDYLFILSRNELDVYIPVSRPNPRVVDRNRWPAVLQAVP